MHDAASNFEKIKYKDSAQDMYQEFVRRAKRIAHAPDKYTFRSKYMERLPANIRAEIIKAGVTAEISTTRDIVEQAVIEENTL